ncbi:purine-cytosine permease family protein [Kutzneria kofuensis]|uniref:purine-cytosine permease family protein n=1 Tax=Kutzneria kofuensis TaxID=103725 RepID=UPI003CD069D1
MVTVDRTAVEQRGIEHVPDEERYGTPSRQFWVWSAANLSMLPVGYGLFVVAVGLNWWQAMLAVVIGIALSYPLVGAVAIAGTRGGAPAMMLSRASFGVLGSRLPTLITWFTVVGWETVSVALGALATRTVLERLSPGPGRNGDGGVGVRGHRPGHDRARRLRLSRDPASSAVADADHRSRHRRLSDRGAAPPALRPVRRQDRLRRDLPGRHRAGDGRYRTGLAGGRGGLLALSATKHAFARHPRLDGGRRRRHPGPVGVGRRAAVDERPGAGRSGGQGPDRRARRAGPDLVPGAVPDQCDHQRHRRRRGRPLLLRPRAAGHRGAAAAAGDRRHRRGADDHRGRLHGVHRAHLRQRVHRVPADHGRRRVGVGGGVPGRPADAPPRRLRHRGPGRRQRPLRAVQLGRHRVDGRRHRGRPRPGHLG